MENVWCFHPCKNEALSQILLPYPELATFTARTYASYNYRASWRHMIWGISMNEDLKEILF